MTFEPGVQPRFGLVAVLAALAGSAQAVSLATPWNGQPLWWLQGLSLALLVGLLWAQPTWRRAAVLGWLFATVWLAGTWWWLYVSLHVYGGLAPPLAAAAVFLLAAALATYYALAAALAWWLGRGGPLGSAAVFAAAWLLAELMRGTWFTGFPWGAGGYAHVEGPLAALAPWVGVYGIGFVAALLAALLAAWTRPRSVALTMAGVPVSRLRPAGGVAGVLILMVGAAHQAPAGESSATGAPLSVALLQGNIAQDEKFQPGSGVPQALQWYGQALRTSQAALVVAPETAIPLLPDQLPTGYLEGLEKYFQTSGQAALVGIPWGNMSQGYTNTVLGLQGNQPRYLYDKHHLVPFGEFIPPLFRWFTDLMNIPLGEFKRGVARPPSFEWRGQRLAPTVCYEDLFGEELAARFVDPAQWPTVLVNMSNIAWFGPTVAIDQHLQISRMRALEFRRPMIRATNTGATALIDSAGVVYAQLAPHTRGVLTGEVQGLTGLTPFARWCAAWGLWPLWSMAGAMVVIALLWGRRGRWR